MRDLEGTMNLNYEISLHRDEEGTYFATVQELPGCMADGETPNDAVENLREAMKSWMASRIQAGLEIPEPRDTAGYSGKVLLRMPRSLHKKLSQRAAAEGVSLNQYVVSALSEACGTAAATQSWNAAAQSIYQLAVNKTGSGWFQSAGYIGQSIQGVNVARVQCNLAGYGTLPPDNAQPWEMEESKLQLQSRRAPAA